MADIREKLMQLVAAAAREESPTKLVELIDQINELADIELRERRDLVSQIDELKFVELLEALSKNNEERKPGKPQCG